MAYLNSYDNQAPRANVKFVGARVNGWPATLVLTAAPAPLPCLCAHFEQQSSRASSQHCWQW